MIGSVSANRRANAFAHLLNEPRRDQPRLGEGETAAESEGEGAEQSALLSVVERLAALPRPELAAETRTVQRAQLIAAMESGLDARGAPRGGRVPEQRGAPAPREAPRPAAGPGPRLGRLFPRTRLSRGLAAGGLTMGVAAGAFGGVAAATSDALPGDTFYGLKRGMEDLRLDFTDGDADRGRVYLDHASTRLSEARRLLERGPAHQLDHDDLSAIRRALTSMRDDALEGHRLLALAYESDGSIDPMRSLSAFTDGHRDTWAMVRDQLPVQLSDVGDEVTDVFDAMAEDIEPLEALLPPEPERLSSAEAPAATTARPPEHPEHSRPAATPGTGTPGEREESQGTADGPSESAEESEGLLGDTGLLDPVVPDDSPRESTPSDSPESAPALPDADITVPPLVEDLLPRLGLDVEKDR